MLCVLGIYCCEIFLVTLETGWGTLTSHKFLSEKGGIIQSKPSDFLSGQGSIIQSKTTQGSIPEDVTHSNNLYELSLSVGSLHSSIVFISDLHVQAIEHKNSKQVSNILSIPYMTKTKILKYRWDM